MNSADRAGTGPAVDVLVQSPLWRAAPESEAMIHRAIATAAAMLSTGGGELAIVLGDDSAIRLLNRDWRGIDKPTNVLSFPAKAAGGRGAPQAPLGDIVIAYETTAEQAEAEGKPFLHHLAHLAIHGFLHLLGHDHQNDQDADAMEALERRILAQLGIPDPYLARDNAA
jgi:probable rRNA maturation factor